MCNYKVQFTITLLYQKREVFHGIVMFEIFRWRNLTAWFVKDVWGTKKLSLFAVVGYS